MCCINESPGFACFARLAHDFLARSRADRAYFKTASYAHAKQTSNLCTINSRELKRFAFFVPGPDEQKEMVALLSAADAQVEAVRSEISALDRLKRSLLQNLLTGRVRVKVDRTP